jgi:hypothetical protein
MWKKCVLFSLHPAHIVFRHSPHHIHLHTCTWFHVGIASCQASVGKGARTYFNWWVEVYWLL